MYVCMYVCISVPARQHCDSRRKRWRCGVPTSKINCDLKVTLKPAITGSEDACVFSACRRHSRFCLFLLNVCMYVWVYETHCFAPPFSYIIHRGR